MDSVGWGIALAHDLLQKHVLMYLCKCIDTRGGSYLAPTLVPLAHILKDYSALSEALK